ncbi:hypothetical protein TNCV_95811 [Trichonephila clavipes]|nr:hypothetical protein TNCV_95811 [Trichonephila clavipes]
MDLNVVLPAKQKSGDQRLVFSPNPDCKTIKYHRLWAPKHLDQAPHHHDMVVAGVRYATACNPKILVLSSDFTPTTNGREKTKDGFHLRVGTPSVIGGARSDRPHSKRVWRQSILKHSKE